MAEISGFHNSVNGDRRVKADFFARFFGSLIGNGVFPNPSTGLQVIANGDMTVTVKAGKAWINGVFYENTADMTLSLDVADGVLKRIDRVVLQYSTIDRTIAAKVKKGTFASTPVAQTLQRDSDAYELGLADILISNGAISIAQLNITDLRLNTSFCGNVHGLIDQVDTETIFNQYFAWFGETKQKFEADFDAFLADLQNTLSGDVAGNLLNKINENTADISQLQKIQTAGGTATAITLTGVELTDGFQTTFVILASNSGAATTINTKPLYKPGTTIAPKLVAGKAATVWYNTAGDCFFIKASAEGDATAANVLAGKTFSNDDDTGLIGAMPNRGAVTITPGTANQAIAAGYHNGSGYVVGDADLIPSNILYGKDIFGITGSFSNIKSIQRGYYTYTNKTSVNIAISAVDLTKAVCIAYTPAPYSITNHGIESKLTSATNLNLSTAAATATSFTVYWTVIEFDNVKTLQRGEYGEFESSSEHITTISAVNTEKSLIFASCKSPDSGAQYVTYATHGRFISSNQIAITTELYVNRTVYWFVVEFN